MADLRPFRLGVNYWPSRTAMDWWPRFEPHELAADLERIAGAGMDSARFFLRWEDYQPEPYRVDPGMLGRLVEVADAAGRAGVELMPTLFTGHMSGVNWIPGWALGGDVRDPRFRVVSGGRVVEGGLRNWFTDPDVARAQALLAGEAAAALAGHPALWAWDLGNENSNCSTPPDREFGRRWLAQMTSAIRGADPHTPITIGLHMEDLEEDRHLGPREAAEACDFLTMHGYPIYAGWAEGPTDPHVVPFLARITRWLGGGKQVMFSEFGLPTFRGDDGPEEAPSKRPAVLVEEEAAASYTRRVLTGLRDAGCSGAMLWCYADYEPVVWTEPPLDEAVHERSFGLWRADGSAKPAVGAVSAAGGTTCVAPPDDGWIDIDAERFWQQPRVELARLYGRYRGSTTAG
jgi:endo-1,4-beta-mannosidase